MAEANGETVVFAARDAAVIGVLTVADTLKPTSPGAIARLREMGLCTILLTGDNEASARAMADAVGIDEVIAGVHGRDPARRERLPKPDDRGSGDGRELDIRGNQ